MTSLKRIIKLIEINNFLLQKLIYHKNTRAIKMRFLKKVIKFRANIKGFLTNFDRAFEEKLITRANTKFIMLNY